MVARTGLFVAPLPGPPIQGTSPTDGRLVLGALFGVSGGCLSGGTLTASGSLMQVGIAAAVWRIPDPTNAAGVYLSPADAATVTFSAGPASGSRIDVIWVRQNNYEAGDADSRLTYGVTAGTAATTPTEPAIPAGAMKIGKLTVPTGVTNAAACTLVPSYGGQLVLAPQRAAGTEAQLPAVGDYVGQLAYVASVTVGTSTAPIVERWSGSAWVRWESDWLTYNPTVAGISGTLNGSPGWFFTTVGFRYTGGKVRLRVGWALNGGSAAATGQQTLSLPVNAAAPGASRMQAPGQVQGFDAAPTPAEYKLVWTVGATTLYIGVPAGTNGATAPTNVSAPFTWAQSDQVDVLIEYDPA